MVFSAVNINAKTENFSSPNTKLVTLKYVLWTARLE